LLEFLFWVIGSRLRLAAFILALFLAAWAALKVAGLID
jgi:hypothetical protein